ncbi:hypothetical protein K439DRAFT_1373179, partial [Ramaria rubella]
RQIETISSDLNISKQVVEHILHLWRTMGEVMIPQKKKKRIRVMTPQEMDTLVQLVQEFPNLYLDKMQKILQEMFGVVVGISTLWATLRELGLSRKKVGLTFTICPCPLKSAVSSPKLQLSVTKTRGIFTASVWATKMLSDSSSLMRVVLTPKQHTDSLVGLRKAKEHI